MRRGSLGFVSPAKLGRKGKQNMQSITHFINPEGIEISITIPYTTHPEWSKKVKAWKHVIVECWGFKEKER